LKITYGYNIEPHNEDPLVNLADLALQQFSKAVVPGAWLVDMIPACKFPLKQHQKNIPFSPRDSFT